MTAPAPTCGLFVHWWDGEYEGNCELPEGHDGDHFDGLAWFTEDRELVRWADAEETTQPTSFDPDGNPRLGY